MSTAASLRVCALASLLLGCARTSGGGASAETAQRTHGCASFEQGTATLLTAVCFDPPAQARRGVEVAGDDGGFWWSAAGHDAAVVRVRLDGTLLGVQSMGER